MPPFHLPEHLNPFIFAYHRVGPHLSSPFSILYLLLLCGFKLRLILACILIKLGYIEAWLHYDTLFSITYNRLGLRDGFLYLAFSFTFYIVVFIHCVLHCQSIKPFYSIFNYLVTAEKLIPVNNEIFKWKITANYGRINQMLKQFEILWRLHCNQLVVLFKISTKTQTRECPFTALSYRSRKKLYLIYKVAELVQIGATIISTIVLLVALFLYGIPALKLEPLVILLTIFDFTTFYLVYIHFFKEMHYFIILTGILILAIIAELTRINRIFTLRQCFKSNYLVAQSLRSYSSEHSRICRFIGRFNRVLISPFSYVHINAAIIFNIYTLLCLQFYTVDFYLAIVAYGTIAVQILIPLVQAIWLIRLNTLICSTRNRFYQLRGRLFLSRFFSNYFVLVEILRSAHYFERLNSSRKPAAMTAGLFGEITRMKLLKFGLAYFAYLKKTVVSFR